jgi:hypothetical protein
MTDSVVAEIDPSKALADSVVDLLTMVRSSVEEAVVDTVGHIERSRIIDLSMNKMSTASSPPPVAPDDGLGDVPSGTIGPCGFFESIIRDSLVGPLGPPGPGTIGVFVDDSTQRYLNIHTPAVDPAFAFVSSDGLQITGPGDWVGVPVTIEEAINRMAAVVAVLNGGPIP